MTLEEFNKLTQTILQNHTDQALVSEQLSTLTTDYATVTQEKDEALSTLEQLKKDNETLRNANMQLFLKVGEQVKPETKQITEPDKKEIPSVESLFDKDGNLL